MPAIVSIGTAVPPYAIRQDHAREIAGRHFAGKIGNLDKYLRVFDTALVEERHLCAPPEWFLTPQGLGHSNRLYLEWAERLATQAVKDCFDRSNVDPREVSHILFISSTGIATPSLDVAVIEATSLKLNTRRVPLFGLGCAGGAAGIAIGGGLADALGSVVLIVSVELNSLTFQRDDYSKSNLVSASLFGDGAAAVLIGPEEGVVELLNSTSLLQPGTQGLMGWDLVDTGFQVVFSRRVPTVIREMMPAAVTGLLEAQGLASEDLKRFVLHPGGRRILEAYEELLGKDAEDFGSSYSVLRRFGNMSSATVLFVLAEELRGGTAHSGEYGLLAAFGPGFSAETTLLLWG